MSSPWWPRPVMFPAHHAKNSVVVCVSRTLGLFNGARYLVKDYETSRIGGEMVIVEALDDVPQAPRNGFWAGRFERALL